MIKNKYRTHLAFYSEMRGGKKCTTNVGNDFKSADLKAIQKYLLTVAVQLLLVNKFGY